MLLINVATSMMLMCAGKHARVNNAYSMECPLCPSVVDKYKEYLVFAKISKGRVRTIKWFQRIVANGVPESRYSLYDSDECDEVVINALGKILFRQEGMRLIRISLLRDKISASIELVK